VLLSCILADMRVITNFQPPSWISDFRFHLGVPGSVTDSTIEKFDPENMGLAVGILFLGSLEAEIPLGAVLPPSTQTSQNNLQHMRVKERRHRNRLN